MRRLFVLFVIFASSSTVFSQDTFLNFGMGPDFLVKSVEEGYERSRFRMEVEIGERFFAFVLQPAFGNRVFSLFLGPRFMLPFQVGSHPVFLIPDFTTGVDFGFGRGTIATSIDLKFGFRIFYEFKPGMGISFRPFGIALKPFNIWHGTTPNQSKLAVTYEMSFGFSYFF